MSKGGCRFCVEARLLRRQTRRQTRRPEPAVRTDDADPPAVAAARMLRRSLTFGVGPKAHASAGAASTPSIAGPRGQRPPPNQNGCTQRGPSSTARGAAVSKKRQFDSLTITQRGAEMDIPWPQPDLGEQTAQVERRVDSAQRLQLLEPLAGKDIHRAAQGVLPRPTAPAVAQPSHGIAAQAMLPVVPARRASNSNSMPVDSASLPWR